MATDLPPCGVCTNCGKYCLDGKRLGYQCSRRDCKGEFASAISKTDWAECKDCSGNGCPACEHMGWAYVRTY